MDFTGQSAEVVSAGVTVDTSPPSLGRLWLEGGAGGAELVILSARWEPPLDLESGVVELEWALGSTPGSSDILEWNLTDAVSGVEVDGSEFSDGQVLFLSIKVSVLLSWKPQCFYVLLPSPSARVFSRDILKGGGNIGVLAGGRGVLGV